MLLTPGPFCGTSKLKRVPPRGNPDSYPRSDKDAQRLLALGTLGWATATQVAHFHHESLDPVQTWLRKAAKYGLATMYQVEQADGRKAPHLFTLGPVGQAWVNMSITTKPAWATVVANQLWLRWRDAVPGWTWEVPRLEGTEAAMSKGTSLIHVACPRIGEEGERAEALAGLGSAQIIVAVTDQEAMERFARTWKGKAEVQLTTDRLLWIEDFGHLWTRVQDVLSLVS